MTATSQKLVLVLAVMLQASTANADTVITTREVVSCRVESATADSVHLKLPRWRRRSLSTRDVYEIRLSDSSRVVELAAKLPQLRVSLDCGQPVPPQAVRIREMVRSRLDRIREARTEGLPWCADVVDTLPREATPAQMEAWCHDMDFALRECGQSDGTAATLLRDVSQEEESVRRIWPGVRTCCLSGTLGGVGGGPIGLMVESRADSPYAVIPCGAGIGLAVGCVAGPAISMIIGTAWRNTLVARHRNRVNDLVRRTNRVFAFLP
jgi:hypothetical protein